MSIGRIWRCLALQLLICGVSAAAMPACLPDDSALLRQIDLEIVGNRRLTRRVEIPARADVLVEAFEKDIDVRLELMDGRSASASADNAIRRWVPQRLLIEAGVSRSIELAIVGKERTHGSTRVRLYRLDAGSDARCLDFWRTMAAADAEFARGEMITEGEIEAPVGAADQAYGAAARHYASAAHVSRGLAGVPPAQAQLAFAFTLLINTADWEKTAAAALNARDRFVAAGSDYGRDRARFYWARAKMQLARHTTDQARAKQLFDVARNEYLAIAESHLARGERYDHAYALAFAAFVDGHIDRYAESIADWKRALAALEGLDEPGRKLQVRQNLAFAEMELGRYSQALKTYEEALQEADPEDGLEQYFFLLKNLAFAEQKLGKYDAALRHYSEALAVSARTHSDRQRGFALQGLGSLYEAIGKLPEALGYLERALELRPADRFPRERGATLSSLADVLAKLGRTREAIVRREDVLKLVQGPLARARARLELVHDRIDAGDLDVAEAQLREVRADPDVVDAAVRARATLENARLALATGRWSVALAESEAAARRFRMQELVGAEFEALLVRARAACASGDRAGAIEYAERAMSRAEEVRVSSNNPTLRAALWRPLRPAFDFTIGIHARADSCGSDAAPNPLAALAIVEKSRARALDDFRRRLSDDDVSAAGVRRRELFEQLAARRQQIAALSETESQADTRLQILRQDVASLGRELDLAGGRLAPPSMRASNLQESLQSRLDSLPGDAAVVEYWLGEEQAYAWLLTRGRVQLVGLGATSRVDAAARELHASLSDWTTTPAAERVYRAQRLHDLIVKPLPAEFARARTAYFIADGALHTVPFAGLAESGGKQVKFLLDSHDVAVAPTFLATGPQAPLRVIGRGSSALVVADPVYTRDDARFGLQATPAMAVTAHQPTLRGSRSWARLPATAREASTITKLLKPGTVRALTGFDAARDVLLGGDLGDYDIVHFAVHAVADTEAPQLSALVLSTIDAEGRPQVGEVFAGDLLDWRLRAALVVLSGCETALGQASAGEGLLGMRYAAQAAGANTVVASLWQVMDAAGAMLMDDFYAGLIERHLPPVASLSRAMRNGRRQWPDPALWAAFDISTTVP